MTTLYRNSSLTHGPGAGPQPETGYNGYIEPDTAVPPKARPVLAGISVNGVAIPEAGILAEAQNHPAENPGAALMEAARALVVRELLLQEAHRLGIEAQPEAAGDGRMETGEDAAIRRLIERDVAVPKAGEAECRWFYDNNPARFSSETIYEARHILLAAPPADEASRRNARMTAEALIERLLDDPQAFPALAAEHSACPSREQGGNLGQLTHGSTVPEFERALASMSEGELLIEPLESRFGFHVILLERKIPGARLPFEHVRERIAGWLEAASWSKAVAQYIAVLAGRAEICGIDIAAAEGPLIQ
jgi:peptidyl-prolyl cis-trans isomerase C